MYLFIKQASKQARKCQVSANEKKIYNKKGFLKTKDARQSSLWFRKMSWFSYEKEIRKAN